MTSLLAQVMAKVEQLSPEQQDALADVILLELEEREWYALVSAPGSARFLQQLKAEAEQEDRTGTAVTSNDRW
jgi:hypothetical protein